MYPARPNTYDLVLYTCNGSGSARVTAFCERSAEKE